MTRHFEIPVYGALQVVTSRKGVRIQAMSLWLYQELTVRMWWQAHCSEETITRVRTWARAQ